MARQALCHGCRRFRRAASSPLQALPDLMTFRSGPEAAGTRMPSRSMLALFTAIGGQLCRASASRGTMIRHGWPQAILSANAVPFQSQPCDARRRCSMKIRLNIHPFLSDNFDTGLIAFDGVRRETHRRAPLEPVEALVRDPWRADLLDRGVGVPRSSSHIPRRLSRARYASKRNSWKKSVGSTRDLPRFAKACLAAEFAPHGCGLGKVAGGDVMPNLVPLGWRQYPSTGLLFVLVRNDRASAARSSPARRVGP